MTYDDIFEWLAWGLFAKHVEEMTNAEQVELDGYVESLATVTDSKFPVRPAGQGKIQCMRPTLEPIVATHMPLVFYLNIALIDAFTGLWLRRLGFQLHQAQTSKMQYWVLEKEDTVESKAAVTSSLPSASSSFRPPLAVFAHGMGIGLAPYCAGFLPLLLSLLHRETISGIVLLRQPHVSMSRFESSGQPPSPGELVQVLVEIQSRHGHVGFSTTPTGPEHRPPKLLPIGHSYGSFLVAQACRLRPDIVHAAIFLDPMCFMLHLSRTTFSFCYEPCSLLPLSKLVTYVVRSEFGMNVCMRRNFHWHQNCLFLDDLYEIAALNHISGATNADSNAPVSAKSGATSLSTRHAALIVIAEKENKMPREEVLAYLKGAALCESDGCKDRRFENLIDLVVLPGAVHGDVILPSMSNSLATNVENLVQQRI